MSKLDRCCVRYHKRKLHSDVFKKLLEDQETGKEKAFVVYYDYIRADSKLKISTIDDPWYQQSSIRSSIKDDNVYRGFDRKEVRRKQKIADGTMKLNKIEPYNNFEKDEALKYRANKISSDSEFDSREDWDESSDLKSIKEDQDGVSSKSDIDKIVKENQVVKFVTKEGHQ